MKPLTIVGRGNSWNECPFSTEELWGTITCLLTEGLSGKKYTKVFAFDNDAKIKEAIEIAQRRKIPIVSLWDYATEIWPSREIVKDTRSGYFLNSLSRMLAYAIYLKYQKIFIYGIDQGPEWPQQQAKPHVCFWLGFAMGRGIDIRLGRGSMKWSYSNDSKPLGNPVLDPNLIAEALAV